MPNIAVAQGDENDAPKIERPTEADLPGHLAPEERGESEKGRTVIRPPAGKKYRRFSASYALDSARQGHVASAKSHGGPLTRA